METHEKSHALEPKEVPKPARGHASKATRRTWKSAHDAFHLAFEQRLKPLRRVPFSALQGHYGAIGPSGKGLRPSMASADPKTILSTRKRVSFWFTIQRFI